MVLAQWCVIETNSRCPTPGWIGSRSASCGSNGAWTWWTRHKTGFPAGSRPRDAQSTDAPEMRTSSATLGNSALKNVGNSSGVLPTGS